MLRSLSNLLETEAGVGRAETLVIGVSGGPDSTALLHLLLALNREHDWSLSLHIAHLNHGLRTPDGDRDAAFVQAAADSLHLPCHIESIDVTQLAKTRGGGVEEVGRQARYAFFERVAQAVAARFVVVAHHEDDNAETILHRILRGTGLRGLAGIALSRPVRPDSPIQVVRPLLRFRKRQLLNYLADNGIACREDTTNKSNELTRNRIRNQILPLIEENVNPQVREALTRLAEQARWHNEYLHETAWRTFQTLVISHTDQALALNVEALARKSRIVQTELVRLAYTAFELGEQDLSFAHVVAVLDLIADPASGRQAHLPGGMTVTRSYHRLIFSLPTDQPRETIAPQIAVHLPGKTQLPIRQLEIECIVEDVDPGQIAGLRRRASRFEEFVSFDEVRPPLVVRKRRDGDRFWPLGAPGTKKLSDFFSDAKVTPEERDRVAILCDQLGPIWIIGHRIDERVRLTSRTRQALHLRATRLG